MRIYLTHCSKEKDPSLKGTSVAVTPDKLYTNPGIQQFMTRCQAKNVNWAILSDLYGIYFPDERHVWYEKAPHTVTPQEEEAVIQDFNTKLDLYNEIHFYIREETFHPFYERVLKNTLLASKVKVFQDIESIERA